MAKSLSLRIAERAAQKKTSVFAQNRSAFLTLREDIRLAINDGWPVKTIWETLHEEGKISFSYQSFRNYVNSLILQSMTNEASEDHNQPSSDENNKLSVEKDTKPEKQPGFVFNPVPNKEELV